MLRIVLKAKYQPQDTTVLPVYNPLPGSWFAAAYLPDWDQHVQQEVGILDIFRPVFIATGTLIWILTGLNLQGIGHKCLYSLGSIALWTQVPSVDTIPLQTTTRLTSLERFTYLK